MSTGKTPYNSADFLQNDLFIEWRLGQTEELEQYWNSFLQEHPESSEAFREAILKFSAIRLNDIYLPGNKKDNLYIKIAADIRQARQRKKRLYYIRFAAVASVLLILLFSVRHAIFNEPDAPPVMENKTVARIVDTNNIRLIINDDDVIELDQKDVEMKLDADGSIVVIDTMKSETHLPLQQSVINKLIVPAGKRTSITLADGTKIWMNSCTELDFPTEFNTPTRNIRIIRGEIYAEVARDETKPFIVNTPQFDVLVHGTKFNISAYRNDKDRSVVLVEGSVSVKTGDGELLGMVPNEMITIGENEVNRQKVNVAEYISWKDGMYIFNKTPFDDVMAKLARYYNVSFHMDECPELLEKTCSGKLLLSNDIDSVMVSVSAISSTTYGRVGNRIYINKKP